MAQSRREQMHNVTRFINAGDYQAALDLLARLDAIEPVPGDFELVNSRICAATGELEDAERFAIAGLKKSPSHYGLYHHLGNILAERGEPQAARSCLIGSSFEQYLNSRYFSAEMQRHQQRSRQDEIQPRAYYDEPEKPFHDSVVSSAAIRQEFSATSLRPAMGGVCVIENGRVWFDGHNFCVYDAQDRLVEHCSSGNPYLIDSIRRERKLTELAGTLGVAVARSAHNYFHWTTDLMPGFHLMDQAQHEYGAIDQYLVSHQDKGFQLQHLALAGVSVNKTFTADVQNGSYFTAEKLIVPVFRHTMAMSMGRWATDYLRGLGARAAQNTTSGSTGRRIYISRRDVGARSILNEEALIKGLQKLGFEDVTLDGMSVPQQMSLFSQCEMIVAPHGAGLTNIVYAPAGTVVVEFFAEFVQPCFRALAHLADQVYLQLSLSTADEEALDPVEKSRKKHLTQFQGIELTQSHIDALITLVGNNAPQPGPASMQASLKAS